MSDGRNHGPFRIKRIVGGEVTFTKDGRTDGPAQIVAIMANNVGVSFACFFGSGEEGEEALATANWFADLANENARLRAAVADLAGSKGRTGSVSVWNPQGGKPPWRRA